MAPTFNTASIPGTGNLYIRFATRLGNMVAELYEQQVPKTVGNFVGLATGAIEFARKAGCRRNQLDTLATLRAAQQLYLSLSFQIIPPPTGHARDHPILMEFKL